MYQGAHWLYLNLADANVISFVPAWAAYRGLVATPNVLLDKITRKTHLGLTPYLTRLFRNHDAVTLEKELMLEQIRRSEFPTSNSRLNCLYCWPDKATARLAPKFWANQGRHFEDRYLVEIGVNASKPPTIVDTRWIDRFVINSAKGLEDLGLDWIRRYWRGEPYPWQDENDIPSEPLRECLVDGTALIYGTSLRMEAYSLVEKIAPDATGILEKGRLGVDLCTRFDGTDEWRLGQIVPVLMSNEERNALQIKHLIRLDEKLAASINEKVLAVGIKPEETNYHALEVFKKDALRLPDLTPVDVDASWLNKNPKLIAAVNGILTAFFLESGGDVSGAKIQRQQA